MACSQTASATCDYGSQPSANSRFYQRPDVIGVKCLVFTLYIGGGGGGKCGLYTVLGRFIPCMYEV
jgi:hypothetical protein